MKTINISKHPERRGLSVFIALFAFFLLMPGCQSEETMKGNVFRIADNLDKVKFSESPLLEWLNTSPEKRSLDEEKNSSLIAMEKFVAENLNLDFIQGQSIHPLRLKVTKPPSHGSGKGERTRNIILAPPKTVFSVQRQIIPGSILSYGYAVVNNEWEGIQGSVRFAVYAEHAKTGEIKLLHKHKLNPSKMTQHRRWFIESLDLQEFSGQKIKLIFETSPGVRNQKNTCLSAWINPAIIEGDRRNSRLNVILISIDTLRADHLGCYGYPKETSPSIDALAKEGVLFKRSIAQAPYTLSSHMSLLTSLYPSFHKVNDLEESHLNSEVYTLAEMFYNAGYRTWAITGGGQVSSNYGFAEGFETYIQYTALLRDVEQKVQETIRYLERDKHSNFFIFFHSYKPHAPYTPRPPFLKMFYQDYDGPIDGSLKTLESINSGEIEVDQDDIDYIISLYDGEIREMDNALEKLFSYLKEDGLESNTLIVLTSDHGEEFNEHGEVGVHSHTLFNELLLIPLIFRLPGFLPGGKIVDDQVQSIDILPTILELAGLDSRDMEFQGNSLLNLIANSGPIVLSDYAFSERLARDGHHLRSAKTIKHKYIHWSDRRSGESGHQYFNLNADPGEQNSLELPRTSAREWQKKIQFLIEEEKSGRIEGKRKKIDKKTLEALKALGYIK